MTRFLSSFLFKSSKLVPLNAMRSYSSSSSSYTSWKSSARLKWWAVGFGVLLASSQIPMTIKAEASSTVAGVKGGIERTFIAIKPDGTQRGLVGEIIQRFERKGYKLVAIKATVPSKNLAEAHYLDLKDRPFFTGLVNYMTSGKAPVCIPLLHV